MTLLPVSFLSVFPICVCVVSQYMHHELCIVCVRERESTFKVSFMYLSLSISPYLARSHTLSRCHSLRPRHQQARMRIAAHAERVCGTEESGWPQTLRCLPQYALRIVCDSVCRRAHTHDTHTHTRHTHTTFTQRNTHTHTHKHSHTDTHTRNAHTHTLLYLLCLTYSFPQLIIKLFKQYFCGAILASQTEMVPLTEV